MKNALLILSFFLIVLQEVNSQNLLSEYAYIVVPQRFDFQNEKDEHQINTLTRHLLREAGFNPIYDVEIKGLPRCEGLYIKLLSESTFLLTKITVLIRDCDNVLLYKSETGSSKEKDYKIAYHEAIRKAFRSIETLGVNQGSLETFREITDRRDAAISNSQIVQSTPEIFTAQQINSKSLPTYYHNGVEYQLELISNGFILYEKVEQDYTKAGSLSKTSREGTYLFNKDGKSMLANFDSDNNLFIDGVDDNGAPIQNKYTKVREE